jgi:hypothetical protein
VQGEPTHLAALVRWFMDAARDDIPIRIHSRDTAEDGDPQWHPSFQTWLLAHPAATDREGHVKSPFRFWMWVMSREGRDNRVMAEWLYEVACAEGDWLGCCRRMTPLTDDGEVMARAFAVTALQRFWRYMQRDPYPNAPRKSESQHRAEEAA